MVRMPDSGTIAAAFHQKAVEYDRHVLVQKRVVTHLVESIGLHLEQEPGNILDVGTGTGALLEGLHARYPHALLTGVDIAFNMCLRAQQKLGSDSRIVTGNAEYLPFGTGVFDLAVSASVLQWVGNLAAALNELRRVVRPGGDVSLAFFCEGSLAELQHCFRDATGRYTHGGGHGHEMSRLHGFHSVAEVLDKTFKTSEKFEIPDVEKVPAVFQYLSGNEYHFMDNVSYEEFVFTAEKLGTQKFYLKENQEMLALKLNGTVVSLEFPVYVELAIAETDPSLKGASISGRSTKKAKLETGLEVQAPLYADIGTILRVNTETGEVSGRA